MTLTVAILTTDAQNQSRLSPTVQPPDELRIRIVVDEPDVSFRALSSADAIVIGSNVSRGRSMQMLRAFGLIDVSSPVLVLVPPREQIESVLAFLGGGASAVVIDADEPGELTRAIWQAIHGRLYLSAEFIPAVLGCYRDLCADLRCIDREVESSQICSRSR